MPLNDDEFVFTTKKPEKMKGDQFTTASLSTIWRKTVKGLKLEKVNHHPYGKPNHFRMHGLRKYFRNNMRADPSYREFWMGHSLGVDEHYISRDPEFHRKEYKKGYESLRILEPATPAQLIEIAEELKLKDQEIQELKNQNKELFSKFEKLDEMLQTLKLMEDKDFSDLKEGQIRSIIRRDPLELIAEKIQKMKKSEKENSKEE